MNFQSDWLISAAMVALLLFASPVKAQSTEHGAIAVEFKINGGVIDLAATVRDRLRDQADKIARHCGYDGGGAEQQVWPDALAEPSSIRLVYPEPVKIKLPRREILVSQAVFLVKDESFLGQPVFHHDGETNLVFKCNGMDMLVLMCMPELKAHFPADYQRSCAIVRDN